MPAADLFMALLLSRPATGSLRTTWVTPATLGLGVATGVVSLFCLGLAVADFHGAWRVAAPLVLALLAAGSLSVAAVGVAQRRA